MSPLERLELEVCAYTLLGSRTQAASLIALLDAQGGIVSYEGINCAKAWKMAAELDASSNAAKTRICLLRQSMEDVGIGGLISTHTGQGYSISQAARKAVITRLSEEANQPKETT